MVHREPARDELELLTQTFKECPSCGRVMKRVVRHMKYHHPEDYARMSFHGKKGAPCPKAVEFRESLPKMLVEVKT